MTAGKKKTNIWGVIAGILAALAALFTVLAYFPIKPICNPLTNCQPQFAFTFEGTGKPFYEVAEGLAYSDANNPAILPFSITVEVEQYSGNQYSGEMDVFIEWIDRDKNKHQELVGKWENFRNQFQTPVKFNLSPSKLFDYAALPASISAYTWETKDPIKGYFDILVRYNDGRELARETITVAHTPWYHQTLLDSAVVRLNQPVTVHIKIVNLGAPANFKITGLLYDTTTPDLSSITDGQPWWVERTWTTKYSNDIVTDTPIGTNKDYTASITVPAEYFLEGHTYAFGSMVFKEMPYLYFANSSDNWANSGERWRYRDGIVYLSIFVVK